MVDTDVMFEALKLAWIPGLLTPGNLNWKTIPDYYPRRVGGLNFLLRCNYVAKYLASLPVFYGNILKYSRELKTMFYLNQVQNICYRYCIYHVKFNFCLVTKPLGVFSSETKWLNASVLFLRMNYVKNV